MTRFGAVCRRSALIGVLMAGVAACAPQPPANRFVVFFTNRSVELDDPARVVVRDAVAAAKSVPSAPVTVSGYADLPGSPEAAERLSLRRAQAVADTMTAAGIAANRIQLRPRGAGAGEPGLESRRVEIGIGG